MTTGSRTHSTPDPADVTSLLRLLAEAADSRSFFARLRRALPRVLPATRVDLLASDWPCGTHMTLSGAAGVVPPDEATALSGLFDSDDGLIESYACGDKLCGRTPGQAEGRRLMRQAPFSYVAGPEVEVRFTPQPRPSEWAFVYNAGLLMDAKRRVKR